MWQGILEVMGKMLVRYEDRPYPVVLELDCTNAVGW